jgi:hypothetical protein
VNWDETIKNCDQSITRIRETHRYFTAHGPRRNADFVALYYGRLKNIRFYIEGNHNRLGKKINDFNQLLADCNPKESTNNLPKPVHLAENGLSSRLIDSCLVGEWRTRSVQRSAKTGGTGILMSIHINGAITINYSGMKELKQMVMDRIIATDIWSGMATGHIGTDSGMIKVISVEKSGLSGKGTDQYGTKNYSPGGLGPVFEGGNKVYHFNYSCDKTTLVIKVMLGTNVLDVYTFKRETEL